MYVLSNDTTQNSLRWIYRSAKIDWTKKPIWVYSSSLPTIKWVSEQKFLKDRNCENGLNITYLLLLECYLNINANTASDVIISATDQSNCSITCCAVVTNNNQQYSLFWWYARLVNYLQVSILLSFERLSTPTTWFLKPQQMALCCLWCDGSHCENTLIQV